MLLAGATFLSQHKQEINSLNVFPVPDGDTGTNMNLTMESAAREMAKKPMTSVPEVADALSMGSLMGARGNSGVILSQIFRGFAKKIAAENELTVGIFADALQEGVNTAYKAVIKPVEGTILTVAKEAARAAAKSAKESKDLNTMLHDVLRQALNTLEQTPDMLPVLKQAGVVDAGGKGLCYIYEGWLSYLEGKAVDIEVIKPVAQPVVVEPAQDIDLEFQYCTEFIVTGDELSEDLFRRELDSLGDSLLVVGTSGLLKIHIHTNNPGQALEFALKHGTELQDIKIENMRLQHTEFERGTEMQPAAPAAERKPIGVIAVASGSGLEEIFRSMGVDTVIVGGQTMNPSTEDFLRAIDNLAAEQIIILPNNSNIILAASQAKDVADRPVAVIPTKTIPQGLAAMLSYVEDAELASLETEMTEASKAVKSGQITFAVRDSVFDGKPIAEGNILGIADGKIAVVGEDVAQTALSLLKELVDDEAEIITLFYGEDVKSEAAQELSVAVAAEFPDQEVELHAGGQPLYFYIIAVE
ncbi:MAG: DAK2 domain-containing protein [Firmicutes bacterium]|nr:DAK2 domain-containing protein [Bacillota bacterium]